MRVLYVTDALAIWGGIERILVEKANFLADNYGYDVHFVTVNQGQHPFVFPISNNVHYVDLDIRFHQQYSHRGFMRLLKYWQLKRLYVSRLREYVNSINPDIILTARASLIFGILAVKGNIPLVFESHSLYIAYRYSYNRFPLLNKKLLCRNVRHADMIVSLTEGDANDWRKFSRKVCVIPNVVRLNNTGRYSNCENKTAIFVGRFSPQKDVQSLLKIWKILYLRHPDWHLRIYGGYGEEQDSLLSLIKNMHANIDLCDPTPNIFEMYCECSILLLTSLFESFGLVLPEAMSCGLPVVAFDCPYGPRDIIRDGVNGFLISDRNVNQFAKKMSLLMDDVSLRVRMGKEGIKSSSIYEDKRIMPMWNQLFRSLESK